MPSEIHEHFIAGVEDAIHCQLKTIRGGSGNAARFADKVRIARSTTIYFPVENSPSNAKSKHEPDTYFRYKGARYPGVIIEISFSQKREALNWLAETYLLDSNASVQVVVGLDIGYDRKKSANEATLSVWRTQMFNTDDGDELRVVKVVADEVSPTHNLSLFTLSLLLTYKGVS